MWGEIKFDYKSIWTKLQQFSTKIKVPFSLFFFFFAQKLRMYFQVFILQKTEAE